MVGCKLARLIYSSSITRFSVVEANPFKLEADVPRGLSLPEHNAGSGEGLYAVEVSPHIILAWDISRLCMLSPADEANSQAE